MGSGASRRPCASDEIWVAAQEGRADDLRQLLRASWHLGLDLNRGPAHCGDVPPMCVAASNDHAAAVGELLRAGARIDATDKRGATPLMAAASKNSVEALTRLLLAKAGADVLQVDAALATAARSDSVAAVKTLLGAVPSSPGDTVAPATLNTAGALAVAARNGSVDVMSVLLGVAPEAAVNSVDQQGRTALYGAAERGRVGAVRLLLGAKASPHPPGSQPAVVAAVFGKSDDALRELLASGADANAVGPDDVAALWAAAGRRVADPRTTLQLLIGAKAAVDQANGQGETPLFNATAPATVRTLLAAKAAVDHADNLGQTPLWQAVGDEQDPRIVQHLLNARASVQFQTVDGQSLLAIAVKAGGPGAASTVHALLRHGADPNSADAHGRTPLHLAAALPSARIVNLLLKANAAVDPVSASGDTPLWKAATAQVQGQRHRHRRSDDGPTSAAESETVVSRLLLVKASPNQRDAGGMSLLTTAARNGPVEVVRLLLQAGSLQAPRDRCDTGPLTAAARHGRTDVAMLLLAAKASVSKNVSDFGYGACATLALHTLEKAGVVERDCPALAALRDKVETARREAEREEERERQRRRKRQSDDNFMMGAMMVMAVF